MRTLHLISLYRNCMVKYTIEEIRAVMNNQDNIRNMSVIAHVDHGKSTLTDSLLARGGLISQDMAGNVRITDGREDEKERGITIKSTGVSMLIEFDPKFEGNYDRFIVNLIDSPGHVDFSSEVTAALRVTDGALVVVDYVEGVCVQTETVLRQALQELIKPVLVINKMDRAFFDLNHDAEKIYFNLVRVIENVNIVISTYQTNEGEGQISPIEGNVSFGSAIQGWGFTLNTFARIYSKKFNIEASKLLKKLWGDNFFDVKTNTWTKENYNSDGEALKRGFGHLIMEPIIRLIKCLTSTSLDAADEQQAMLNKLGISLTSEELTLTGKALVKKAMQKWINVADSLMEMIVMQLPSPKTAQKYRTSYLYEGPLDDLSAKAMLSCDPNGPLMMFVSKLVPIADSGRFYAFGRIFSGTVENSAKVRILGPNYKPGRSDDVYEKNIQRIVLFTGRKEEDVTSVPCGNICGIVGVDQYILKQGTVVEDSNAYPIRTMKYSVSPVVRVAVRPKIPSELPKLIEGLKKMAQVDPLVQVITTENETIVAGSGELHLEICLNDLVKEFAKIEIVKSDPVVPYKETVTHLSSKDAFVKTGNKKNRFYATAEPLDENLILDIEKQLEISDKITIDPTVLINEYGWDKLEAKKIWAFGPNSQGSNILVDHTKAVMYLTEVKDSLINSFNWATREGVLAEEPLRGTKFRIIDAVIHSDSSHRGPVQVTPAARRLFLGSQLTAEPRFVEPMYLVEISTPSDCLSSIYQCFSQRRGVIFSEESVIGTPLIVLKGHLPVAESFGFSTTLRQLTSGQAFPQCVFDHWELVNQDPLDTTTSAYSIMKNIRLRKGLKIEIPDLNNYIDKL